MADSWKTLKYTDIFPTAVIKSLDKALSAISTVYDALTAIVNFLRLFVSSFSSFSTVIKAFIDYCQNKLTNFTADIGGAGVYMNILVPPAFVKALENNQSLVSLSTGGFDGFMERLRVSLHNTADKNTPRFSDEATVGGLIVLLDTETLYDFYRGVDFLKGMFDFMDLVPINTTPPPPRNIRGVSNYYTTKKGMEILDENGNVIKLVGPFDDRTLGIKLEWDPPLITGFTHYKITRSLRSGGVLTTVQEIPTKLVGPKGREEEGLLSASKMFLFDGFEWPTSQKYLYNDETFNNGQPVYVKADNITGGGFYFDTEVNPKEVRQYYYVVQSGFAGRSSGSPGLWGAQSPEAGISTNPKGCISPNQQGIVQHETGVELISAGVGSLGQWSALQAQAVLPFLKPMLDLINGLITSLAGALKTNTKSFVDFLNGIKTKFEKYRSYLEVLTTMISAIENFFSGAPRIALLNIPPEKGGVDHLVNRIVLAQKPSGGFSGRAGLSLGIVFVYGEGLSGDAIGSETEDFSQQIQAISTAFNVVMRCLS